MAPCAPVLGLNKQPCGCCGGRGAGDGRDGPLVGTQITQQPQGSSICPGRILHRATPVHLSQVTQGVGNVCELSLPPVPQFPCTHSLASGMPRTGRGWSCWVQIRVVWGCSTHRWGVRGFGRPSPWFGAAATSMLGNFMLIRENKEGSGSRGGGHAWGRWPHHPQRQGM